MRVLFVCTANVCRSPLAAGLFVHAADSRGITDAFAASAGFLDDGMRVHEHVARLLEERGIDSSRKVSQRIRAGVAARADLILTMTSEHARGVVGRFPTSIRRVYTFRHFVTIVSARAGHMSTGEWLDGLDSHNPRSYVRDDQGLDIPDPIGQGFGAFVKLADELTGSIEWMMDCAYPELARRS